MGDQKLKIMGIDIKKNDSKEIWHTCEPEKRIKLAPGFYKRYEHIWTCIHCKKTHHHIFNNLTIPANI